MRPLVFKTSLASVFLLLFSLTCYSLSYQLFRGILLPSTRPQNTVFYQTVLSAATSSAQPASFPTPQTPQNLPNINILLLGLDAHIGDAKPRCDAIHMISLYPATNHIIITSVPRGTAVTIPGADPNSSYISNLCSILGIPAAVSQIEKITGLEHNYLVKIGFSQAEGIFRLANLPTEPTLEFLRDRKSFGIGDDQRSYNQATFIKDMIFKYANFVNHIPEPIQHLAYATIDTDLPFDQAKSLYQEVMKLHITDNPNNISVVVKPSDGLARQEIHFASGSATTNWQADPTFQNFQSSLITQLQTIATQKSPTLLTTVINQEPWLQIENATQRNRLHFQLLQAFATTTSDKTKSRVLIQDFITEMQQDQQWELALQGQSLLAQTSR